MLYEFINTINKLKSQNRIFSIAIVTGRKAPISGKPGDKAIILEDGQILGWIGGGCTQGVVVTEAKKAMKDGKTRVVRISPEKIINPLPDVIEYNMTCHSGGDIEVYIEPVLPQPQLIIVGKSIVAQTLAKLGKILDYTVSIVATNPSLQQFNGADNVIELNDFNENSLSLAPYNYIIVSTQGENDEGALEKMLSLKNIPYVSFVASRKKAKAVFEYLTEAGFSQEEISKIKVPAGLDINAKTPKEVALSILAEIIQITRNGLAPLTEISSTKQKEEIQESPAQKEEEKKHFCPNCGMLGKPEFTWDYKGTTYFFCCKGCETAFKKDPESILAA